MRRAFLCGIDHYSGKSYEHRRDWLETELLKLPTVFCIDIAAYAIMHNHYHVVLHINDAKSQALSDREIIQRWHTLFKGNHLSQKYMALGELPSAEQEALALCVELWRERLSSISWFMRLLNEKIARQANKEDQCTGRFWEGRFKSQALLDDKALAACMAYVDLNPIRACIANTPERSDFTSIKQRIATASQATAPNSVKQQTKTLFPFAGNPKKTMPEGIPFRLNDYLALVDWSGRLIKENKRGAIAKEIPPILERLNIKPQQWIKSCQHFETQFKTFVGSESHIKAYLTNHQQKSCHGIGHCRQTFT